MTDLEALDLLPADPLRGLDDADIDAARDEFDGITYGYGMRSAAGAARVEAVVDGVARTLSAGLGREVALLTLLGGCLRLERDGHAEYSDTVVRESVRAALEVPCQHAGVAPFTDDEVNEAALMLSLRALDSYRNGFTKALAETGASS